MYVSSHVLIDIVSISINTFFSVGSITKISDHDKYKKKLISFFEPLIKNGNKYYPENENAEAQVLQETFKKADSNTTPLAKKKSKRDIDSAGLSTDSPHSTKKLKKDSEDKGEETPHRQVPKNKRAADQTLEETSNEQSPVVKKTKQELPEPGKGNPANSQSAPSRTLGTLFHQGSSSSSAVEHSATSTQTTSNRPH